ncbi:hypothetical protein GCM10027445_16690 [Amycolatopsis endophytica]
MLLVFVSGFLAVAGVLVVPSATAQTASLSYSVQTSGVDPLHAQDGDPLRITISGLPAGATANYRVCPSPLPDGLLKPGTWAPDHTVAARVAAYCSAFNDELSGAVFAPPNTPRGRSAATQNIVLDTFVPRGSRTPANINFDPEYTQLQPSQALTWPSNPEGKKYSYTCDENNPCTMTLTITGTPPGSTAAQTVYDSSITFAASAPGLEIQGCGGVGASTLNASMPERFGDTAVSWNQMLCAPTQSAQPANIVAETEDAGLRAFDTGASDIAMTGSGGRLASQTERERAYVPAALNATVIAAVGWAPTDVTDSGALVSSRLGTALTFTWDDVANMLSKGGLSPSSTGRGGIFRNGSPLVTRNPALDAIKDGNGNTTSAPETRAGVDTANLSFFGVTGESGPSTVPAILSGKLASAAPGAWVYGTTSYFADKGGGPVGTVTDLNALNLDLVNVHNVDAKSGRVNVRKQVNGPVLGTGFECTNGCLNWVVTDLATATEYGWAPVALPDGHGGYVAPTPASLRAAAAHATQAEDGSVTIGDVSADPAAYPLTFVESVAAPVNPLIDESCQPLADKQAQLATFLKAATNGGQGGLGAGLVPLTPELLSAAQEAAALVGTGTAAEACQEREDARNPGSATGGSSGSYTTGSGGDGLGTGFGTGGLGAGGSGSAAGAAPLDTKVPTPESLTESRNLAASTKIPFFPGGTALAALIPLLALVGLVVLPAGTAYASAGRPLPPWLDALKRRITSMRSGS